MEPLRTTQFVMFCAWLTQNAFPIDFYWFCAFNLEGKMKSNSRPHFLLVDKRFFLARKSCCIFIFRMNESIVADYCTQKYLLEFILFSPWWRLNPGLFGGYLLWDAARGSPRKAISVGLGLPRLGSRAKESLFMGGLQRHNGENRNEFYHKKAGRCECLWVYYLCSIIYIHYT